MLEFTKNFLSDAMQIKFTVTFNVTGLSKRDL